MSDVEVRAARPAQKARQMQHTVAVESTIRESAPVSEGSLDVV